MTAETQKGFTLIELVVVITILGILAAFAVPRFVSLESEARTATVEGLEGAVRSAAALAHALSVAQGNPATVDMEGNTITLVNGYPNLATIDDALADLSGFNYDPATGDFNRADVGAGTCGFTYVEAGVGTPPQITPDLTDC